MTARSARGPAAAALLLLLLRGAGCAPADEPLPPDAAEARQEVRNGTPATEDAAVVGIAVGGEVGCTGVLIRPRVVLTAAHCLAGHRPDTALVGPSAAEGVHVGIARAWSSPDYRAGAAEHDIGLLLLREPLDVAPVPLRAQPLTDEDAGRSVRFVGFGREDPDERGDARRMQGTAVLGEVGALRFSLTPSPSSACSGDSGGPVFGTAGGGAAGGGAGGGGGGAGTGGGGEVLLGLISRGDEACAERASAVRVDAHLGGFIEPVLAAIEQTGGEAGEPCVEPGNCASGLCVSPEDAPSFPYCSRACGGPADCPASMRCEGVAPGTAQCRYARPSPGAIGAPCERDEACEFGMCARFGGELDGLDGDESPTCSALCFPEDPEPCPHGGVCSPVAGAARVHGCRYEAPAPVAAVGGCAVGRFPPGAGPGGRWLALVGAGALVVGLRGLRALRRRAASRRGGRRRRTG
ncbi:trypsin-like serine protease [Sorangium sp. So ce1389]|uniref:trypsin-like serine protease n=1 Tax=Sorangium sp. So ce1389 TaxID=3133336 RepID=UPI003F644F0F